MQMCVRVYKKTRSTVSTYLFLPVGPECHPHQDQGLHQCAPDHAAPNTLHIVLNSSHHQRHASIIHRSDQRCSDQELTVSSRDVSYRRSEVEVEPEEAPEGDADDVVAADIDVRDERLPSAAHGHPCCHSEHFCFLSMCAVE